jgi:hypothetical protein
MPADISFPMRLVVSAQEARAFIDQIPHATCRAAAGTRWFVQPDGLVPEKSVNWLFCWAKTGMGSHKSAIEAQSVFDRILPVKFLDYDSTVAHEYARKKRY